MYDLEDIVEMNDAVFIDSCVMTPFNENDILNYLYNIRSMRELRPLGQMFQNHINYIDRLRIISENKRRESNGSNCLILTRRVYDENRELIRLLEQTYGFLCNRWKVEKEKAVDKKPFKKFSKYEFNGESKVRRLKRIIFKRRETTRRFMLDDETLAEEYYTHELSLLNELIQRHNKLPEFIEIYPKKMELPNYKLDEMSDTDNALVLALFDYLQINPNSSAAIITRDNDIKLALYYYDRRCDDSFHNCMIGRLSLFLGDATLKLYRRFLLSQTRGVSLCEGDLIAKTLS